MTILVRGLLTFAFFGADTFVTLAVVTVRHRSVAFAGVGAHLRDRLTWTVGAWEQARLSQVWEGRKLVRVGLTLVLVGICGMLLVVRPRFPVEVSFAAWAVAGLGMGLAYAPTSLMMLREAPAGREGWASASLSLSDVLGAALGAGFGGAAIAISESHGWSLTTGISVAFVFPAVVAVLALGVTGRLPLNMDRAVAET